MSPKALAFTLLFVCLAVSASADSRRKLLRIDTQDALSNARSALDYIQSMNSGSSCPNSFNDTYYRARTIAHDADQVMNDRDGRRVAAATACSAVSGVASAAAAAASAGSTIDLSDSIAIAEELLTAAENNTNSGRVSNRVKKASKCAIKSAEAVVKVLRAIHDSSRDNIDDAFDEVDDVADNAYDASRDGADNAAAAAAKVTGYVVLSASAVHENQMSEASNEAYKAALATINVAQIAVSTSDNSGSNCSASNLSRAARSLTNSVDDYKKRVKKNTVDKDISDAKSAANLLLNNTDTTCGSSLATIPSLF